jgi:cytochrome c biogenesis protein CcmG/thiol:disulfide interchange protein DsbE
MSKRKTDSTNTLWTPGRIIATVVVMGLIAAIGYTLFSGGTRAKVDNKVHLPAAAETTAGAAPLKAGPVLPDYQINTFDGRTVKISDYRGKVLVVDFWATWCPPCQMETPELVRIANSDGPKGVEVVGLHIDDRGRSSPQQIRDFINKYKIPYTVGMANDEMFLSYLGKDDDTIPQTLVFNREGKLVAHMVGFDPSDPSALDKAVDQALGPS